MDVRPEDANPNEPLPQGSPAEVFLAVAARSPQPADAAAAVALIVIGFGVVDLVVVGIARSHTEPLWWLAGLLSGVVLAQFGLLAVWAVFGPGRLLVRWPAALLAAAALLCGLAMLLIAGEPLASRNMEEFFLSLLMLPLFALAVQFPLWAFKWAIGGRIVILGSKDAASASASRQFTLQHLLGVTTVLAIALSMASVALEYGGLPGRPTAEMWPRVLIACTIFALYSALAVVPCIWAALIVRDMATSVFALAVYVLLGSGLEIAIVSAIFGPPFRAGHFAPVVTLNIGTVAAIFATLRVLRAYGCVLLRAGGSGRADADTSGPGDTGRNAEDAGRKRSG